MRLARRAQTVSVQPNTAYTYSAFVRGSYLFVGVDGGASTWTPGTGLLTMAPETFFIQLGYTNYGPGPFGGDPRAGSYLPMIHAPACDPRPTQRPDPATRPALQLGPHHGPGQPVPLHRQRRLPYRDGRHAARRLPHPANPADIFPALRADQVAVVLPAGPLAGNGFTTVAVVQQALGCLARNQGCGGYTLRAGAQPAIRGLMTWSINWDRFYGWEFSRSHEPFLNALP